MRLDLYLFGKPGDKGRRLIDKASPRNVILLVSLINRWVLLDLMWPMTWQDGGVRVAYTSQSGR